MFSGVRAKCKRCGKQDDSTTFVLDSVYRVMVCRDCVKERKEKENMAKEKEKALKVENQKPAGWDSDDEYIEKRYSIKKANEPQTQRINSTKVKYTCKKCKYAFVYDEERETPKACPYCGKSVSFGFY